jgi:hypothetical protein
MMAETNCPNCGAPAEGLTCEYCGTPFESPEKALSLAIGKTVSVNFEHEGRLYEFDMQIENVSMDASRDAVDIYSDNTKYKTVFGQTEYEASMSGRLVPSVKHGRECVLFYRELAPEEVTC